MFNRYQRSVHVNLEIDSKNDSVKFTFVESKPTDHSKVINSQKDLYALAQLPEVIVTLERLLFDKPNDQYVFSNVKIKVQTVDGRPPYTYSNDNYLSLQDMRVVLDHVCRYMDHFRPKNTCCIL